MYAITGITGQVGAVLGKQLLAAGLPVRAVVRDAAKGETWAARGAEVALADVNDAAALTHAFSGAEAVFVLLPPTFDPTDGFPEARRAIAALREALAAARPGRVVVLSTIGAQATQPNLLNQLGIMERELGTLDLPITFLRAAWFIENSLWDVASARGAGTIASFLQPLDKPVPMVACADISAVAAELLQQQWQGVRVVELEGPVRISPADIAASFGRLLHKDVHAHVVAREGWSALFTAQGMRNPTPRMQMLDGFNQGWIEFEGAPRRGSVTLDQAISGLLQRVQG
ncbi:NAD(P)H-binding protein [Duganella callida]|uniref:NAD-dependent epimerase/dehydratase family protein n=1 Tax=Duganella callida TaxID=2561932 RepID=A0A4Y9SVM9_9BURK|nr:NAD(P)H-binding protein [Duganella callida]TFW28713.1 NAD-dependent epimerase/dehydratase family protein [Duganella callida]